MINLNDGRKPEIEYPTKWKYKIIGDNVDNMLAAVKYAVEKLEHDVTPSNVSKKGKYFSLNLTVKVPTEVKRNEIYKTLEADKSIKFVL